MYWYEVIERLFTEFGININVPGPEWLERDVRPQLDAIQEGSDAGSDGSDGTVVHYILSPEAPNFIHGSLQHSMIRMMGPAASSL